MTRVVVLGRDAALWLSAAVLQRALGPAWVSVTAVELPSALTPVDAYAALPPIEALHNRLRIDEDALIRTTGAAFTLGQNFSDAVAGAPPFLHAYGSAGAEIDGHDFFAYWLKARAHGLAVGLEDFSLTAAAARQGRLLIPDDDTEIYGRSDYGYHLPARAYAAVLKDVALHHGVTGLSAASVQPVLDPETGDVAALALDGDRRVEADLFVDATGAEALLIGEALGVPAESWRDTFFADRVLTAMAPRLPSLPVYAEIRAGTEGWTGLFPSQAGTHVVHVFSSAVHGDDHALEAAASASGLPLAGAVVRTSSPQRRVHGWSRNCVAIGEAACAFDPVHGVDLHAIQLGLINLLARFPSRGGHAAQRNEFNRLTRSAFERVRDFQSAHYALNRYGEGPFWSQARAAHVPPELVHRIALFEARGEVAPWEDESFAPDSWRMLFTGHGLSPRSWLPTIDRTSPDVMKASFRRMLGFVREQVLRQPTHDAYLARVAAGETGRG